MVGGSGDLGADIVGWQQGKRWVLQAKFRSTSNTGRQAVAEAFDSHWHYDADVIVAATNRFFTNDAYVYRAQKIEAGFQVNLWDQQFLLEQFDYLSEYSAAKRTPRDYQRRAIECIHDSMNTGDGRGLITLATGLGKTMVAATFISEYLEKNPDAKVLVLAHMSDLVRQLERACWPQLSKYSQTHVWTDGEYPSSADGVTFATWQSVDRAFRGGEPLEGAFDLVIVDECHHAPSSTYSALLRDLRPGYLLGVTATPWRGDGANLRPLFGDPVFSMDVVKGMQRGFLAEVDYQMMIDGIDWEEIRNLSIQGLTVRDLNQKLYVPERDLGMIEAVCEAMSKMSTPRVLVFCRSIPHANRLANFFRQFDIAAGVIHNELHRSDRFRNLTNFRAGSLKVLISIEMLNEGIDVPEVNLVVFARVTHSRRIFLQQLGRGLRLSENKKSVQVLDFVADVRRVAAGVELNAEAIRIGETETVNYPDGEIVRFSNHSQSFFREYLQDMASIDDLDEDAHLDFPI